MSKRTDESVIRGYLRALKAAGWTVSFVDNGGGPVYCQTEKRAMEEITATDDAGVRLVKYGPKASTKDGVNPADEFGHLYFVLGNDPEEVLNDHSVNLTDVLRPYEATLE